MKVIGKMIRCKEKIFDIHILIGKLVQTLSEAGKKVMITLDDIYVSDVKIYKKKNIQLT